MSEKSLRIFELCKQLAELLEDKNAVADLQLLLERHPEMFKNKEEVANLIQKVIDKPEIIIKNPTPLSEKDYIAGKKLNDEKMGEIGIRKNENISKIFHANEKNIKKLKQLDKKEVVYRQSMVGTPTSYTQAQSLDERLVDNNISLTADSIIPNSNAQSQTHKSKTAKMSQDKQKSNTNEISM